MIGTYSPQNWSSESTDITAAEPDIPHTVPPTLVAEYKEVAYKECPYKDTAVLDIRI